MCSKNSNNNYNLPSSNRQAVSEIQVFVTISNWVKIDSRAGLLATNNSNFHDKRTRTFCKSDHSPPVISSCLQAQSLTSMLQPLPVLFLGQDVKGQLLCFVFQISCIKRLSDSFHPMNVARASLLRPWGFSRQKTPKWIAIF